MTRKNKLKLLSLFGGLSLTTAVGFTIACSNEQPDNIPNDKKNEFESKLAEFESKADELDLNYNYKTTFEELQKVQSSDLNDEFKATFKTKLAAVAQKLKTKIETAIEKLDEKLLDPITYDKDEDKAQIINFSSKLETGFPAEVIGEIVGKIANFNDTVGQYTATFDLLKELKNTTEKSQIKNVFIPNLKSKSISLKDRFKQLVKKQAIKKIFNEIEEDNRELVVSVINNINNLSDDDILVKTPTQVLKESLKNFYFTTFNIITEIEQAIFEKYKNSGQLATDPNLAQAFQKYNEILADPDNIDEIKVSEIQEILLKIDKNSIEEKDKFEFYLYAHFILKYNLSTFEADFMTNLLATQNTDEFTTWYNIKPENVLPLNEKTVLLVKNTITNYEQIEEKPAKPWKEAAWRKRRDKFKKSYAEIVINDVVEFTTKVELFGDVESSKTGSELAVNKDLFGEMFISKIAYVGEFLSKNELTNKVQQEVDKVFSPDSELAFNKIVTIEGLGNDLTAEQVISNHESINNKPPVFEIKPELIKFTDSKEQNKAWTYDKNKFKLVIKYVEESESVDHAVDISFVVEMYGVESKPYVVTIEQLKNVMSQKEFETVIDNEVKKLNEGKLRVKVKDLQGAQIPKFLNAFNYSKFVEVEEEIEPGVWETYSFPVDGNNNLMFNAYINKDGIIVENGIEDDANVNITFVWAYTRKFITLADSEWIRITHVKKTPFDLAAVKAKIKGAILENVEKAVAEAEAALKSAHPTISLLKPLHTKALGQVNSLAEKDFKSEKAAFKARLSVIEQKMNEPELIKIDKAEKQVKETVKYAKNQYADVNTLKTKYADALKLVNELTDVYFKTLFTKELDEKVKPIIEAKEGVAKVVEYINKNFTNLVTQHKDSTPKQIVYGGIDAFIADVQKPELVKAHEQVGVTDVTYELVEYKSDYYNKNGVKKVTIIVKKGNESQEILLEITGFAI
ncbi:Uncharacterised protein [Mycoplasmopsis californica]|uniref:Lipoprotein n=1 Tax=Mycoplasmopsis equigenitalium TaxID=114883 RepID=A0ABY5J2M0_9BACT|nr:hypothetical protein [Mycoplasmopsis equigenitalium]UUD36969.1 hypothetical protein NPA09_00080 [Mycoplasmopsis equigenitalium]VEU69736.1 Uncharacterised protein [Mycoplasmopsis californica]